MHEVDKDPPCIATSMRLSAHNTTPLKAEVAWWRTVVTGLDAYQYLFCEKLLNIKTRGFLNLATSLPLNLRPKST